MCALIVRIESAGPDLRARRIFFEGDPDYRTTASTVVKRLAIAEGMDVDRVRLESELAAEELPLAKERALKLLGYRERSACEVDRKLRDSGFPESVRSAVVQRFCEVELIDDERFASAWTRSRRSGGYGERRIARELADKGITPELIASVLESEDSLTEADRALASLRGKAPCDKADEQRLIKRLLGRGFTLSVARDAVARAGSLSVGDVGDSADGDTVDDLRK